MYVRYHVRVIGVFQGLAIDLKDLIGHFKIGFLGRWTWKDRIDELFFANQIDKEPEPKIEMNAAVCSSYILDVVMPK